ncbi:OmpA family protein [Sphaerotilus sp.]|uniref:OmpA family protein n=1 Tax=Sphaerotilus sp. TaxID=2093942 RepID=UPI0025D1784E|nr:OmpA family protein [Sphaerotilus sp.]
MSRGVCTNLPAACSQAAAKAVLPCPEPDTRCPTCGAALLPLGDGPAAGPGAGAARWVASSLVVALAVGGGWSWWSSQATPDAGLPQANRVAPTSPVSPVSPAVLAVAQAASALESEPPGVGTPNVFVLHGMDALGPVLGTELMEAFLTQEGHVEVHRSLPDPHGAVLVSARRPGGLRQDIRLAFDGGSTAAGDASLRRVSATSGTELKDNQVLVGLDALAVVVHPGNPMERISLSQLRELLSGAGRAGGPVRVNVRNEASDSATLIGHQVLGGSRASADLQRHETDAALVQAVMADEHALGVVPLSAVGGAKVLAVVDAAGSVWKPTPEAVATERYPLTHRLVVQMPAASSPVALRYAQFLAGPAAQTRLRSGGLASAAPVLIDPANAEPVAVGAAVKWPKDYTALTRGAQLLTGRIGFAADSAELDAVAHVDVDRLARQIKEQAAARPVSVAVLGVAHDAGGYCANRALSDKRAASVAEALAAQGVKVRAVRGVGRVVPPSVTGLDETARERRVEVWVSDAPMHQPAPFKCVSGTGQVAMVGAPRFLQSGP